MTYVLHGIKTRMTIHERDYHVFDAVCPCGSTWTVSTHGKYAVDETSLQFHYEHCERARITPVILNETL